MPTLVVFSDGTFSKAEPVLHTPVIKNMAFAVSAAVLLFTVTVSTGCGRATQEQLSGDVFIATQGAQNVKLGLVEVRVQPYEETRASITKTKAQAFHSAG